MKKINDRRVWLSQEQGSEGLKAAQSYRLAEWTYLSGSEDDTGLRILRNVDLELNFALSFSELIGTKLWF